MLIKLRVGRRNLASLYAVAFKAHRLDLRGGKSHNQ